MSVPDDRDLFAVLGLPRRYGVTPEELERRFHERSRIVHPDRFARATPAERRGALERATRLNHAYRTLRDPWRRAEHLVSLLEAPGAEGAPTAEPDFLEEQLTTREELSAARGRHDAVALEKIRARAGAALAQLEREVARALDGAAPAPVALREARAALARVRYHQAAIEDAERALDAHGARRTPA
jgi:molecular chaperone HscB